MAVGNVQTGKRERVKVTIAKDSMTASVLLRESPSDEGSIMVEEAMDALGRAGVVFGLDENAVVEAINESRFNTPIKVASGVKPKRGASTSFEYHFDTSTKRTPKEDEDGRIDYRDISFILNTEKDALLVTKKPPKQGEPGRSVLGGEIAGPPGRDIPFKYGANSAVSDNGLELRSTAGGAILFQNGKVSVMDVLTIKGDVDFKVGNLDSRGSVRVTGDVKAGFELRIDGDLEIGGNVEDADIRVKGNVLVKGGFFGNGKGILHADGDVTVKYAEGQNISSGGNVFIGGEIINCQVIAREKVVIKGSRGKIIGGEVRAGKEIRTSTAGSEAGIPTGLYVAFDSDLMKDHSKTIGEIDRLRGDGKRIAEALYALYRLQIDGKLPADKQEAFKKLQVFKKELPENLKALNQRKADLEEAIAKLKDDRIIVERKLHTGVKAQFGIVYREIVETTERCKITLEGNQVMISDFRGD